MHLRARRHPLWRVVYTTIGDAVKQVPEVCRIFCATANPTEVIVAETAQGRAILGVVDGSTPQGVEDQAGIAWRQQFLRQIGYKLA